MDGGMKRVVIFLFPVISFLTSPLGAVGDPFESPEIIQIQALHDQSAAGDKSATDRLCALLETLLATQPHNSLYRVYLGSALTLKSRDAFPGPAKLRYLKDGLSMMDRAVKDAPENLCVRFVRAVNNFHLPAFVNRRDNARKDFEILLAAIQADSTSLNEQTLQAIYYFAGLAFKQTNRDQQARQTWTQGISRHEESDLTRKMRAELARLNS